VYVLHLIEKVAYIHHRVDYWDSYWIVQGLLKSELYSVANSTLQNFMDEIVDFGFIPNGGRIYYLNRSQPPMFIRVCIISISFVSVGFSDSCADALRLCDG
jgi:neutral trehalase